MAASVRALAFALSTMTAACSGNFHSVYRHSPIDISSTKGSITAVDAKQRVILQRGNVVCAEPNPDVFSVIAQSASGAAGLGRSADPKTVDAQMALAYASAEQGATISRTQTVNLLRDLMYRTCERYLDGAISEIEVPIQAVRDQRLMASMLAIEQLTGAIRPTVIAIGATASGAAGSSSSDGIVAMNNAFDAKQKADQAVAIADAAYSKLNSELPTCDKLIKDEAAGTKIADADAAHLKSCSAAATALASARETQKTATDRLAALRGAGGALGVSGPASATGQTSSSSTNGPNSTATVDAVAAAVENIVKLNYDQDELLLLCLKVLEKSDALRVSDPAGLSLRCESYLKSSVELRTAANRNSLDRFQAEVASINDQFEKFWSKGVAGRKKAINDELNSWNNSGGDVSNLRALQHTTDKATASDYFRHLGTDTKSRLSQ